MSDAALLQEAWASLGVDRRADSDQVRTAWKRKLKHVHPDLGGTKEAAQHATNMRDVLLAWIEAGKPDLNEQPYPAFTPCADTPSGAQNFAWQQARQARPVYPSQPAWEFVGWAIFSLFFMLAGVLLGAPRSEYPRTQQYEPQISISPYHLPPCETTDVVEETKAMLDGKCWPARFRR